MSKDIFRFDPFDLESITPEVAHFGESRFGYVVTPNSDHLVRLASDAGMRSAYEHASYVLLDSRFISHAARMMRGLKLPVCTGSDLTAKLFSSVIHAEDRLVLIGCSDQQASELRARYGLRRLEHYNPPMGFIKDPDAVERTLEYIESVSPFRFCLLAVGSPQQERLAEMLAARGRARGLALCIGASINFITGSERRAPAWMQRFGLEWAYRLLQDPRRLAGRYLVRAPRVLPMLAAARIGPRLAAMPHAVAAAMPAVVAGAVAVAESAPMAAPMGVT